MGSLVRQHRERLGVDRQTLARKSGISRSMLAKIEISQRTPSPKVIRSLSAVLGASFRKDALQILMERS
jgi:transcriptional regulator with XRE-family HTH domain